ncbi:MAG: hypothetical protein ABI270_10455 [Nitrosospira sp.]
MEIIHWSTPAFSATTLFSDPTIFFADATFKRAIVGYCSLCGKKTAICPSFSCCYDIKTSAPTLREAVCLTAAKGKEVNE